MEECGAHAPCIWRFLANIPAFLTSQIHPSIPLSDKISRRTAHSPPRRLAHSRREISLDVSSRTHMSPGWTDLKNHPAQNDPRTGSFCRPGDRCVYRTWVSSQSAPYRQKNQQTRSVSRNTGAMGIGGLLGMVGNTRPAPAEQAQAGGYACILVQIFTKVNSKYLY